MKAAEVEEQFHDAISRVKLRAESLPESMKIATEVQATQQQLLSARKKVGFPLTTLLNQSISYEDHQVRVNYMALPDESWVDYGYSKLAQTEGHKSIILKKDGVLIQMVASTKELEDWILLLLKMDKLQLYRIRFHRSPKDWVLVTERFLRADELKKIEQRSGEEIRQGMIQDMVIKRNKVKIQYFDCGTERSAERVGEDLAKAKTSITKRLARGYGPIVVTVDSSSKSVNQFVLSYMNW